LRGKVLTSKELVLCETMLGKEFPSTDELHSAGAIECELFGIQWPLIMAKADSIRGRCVDEFMKGLLMLFESGNHPDVKSSHY
jgi:hypothetical protein